jgi:hypothetical protein
MGVYLLRSMHQTACVVRPRPLWDRLLLKAAAGDAEAACGSADNAPRVVKQNADPN